MQVEVSVIICYHLFSSVFFTENVGYRFEILTGTQVLLDLQQKKKTPREHKTLWESNQKQE